MAIGVAIGVALMQAYLQRQQLKQNLYDRRFKIRQELQDYYIGRWSKKNDPDYYCGLIVTFEHGENLFGSDVIEYMREFAETIIKIDQKSTAIEEGTLKGQPMAELREEQNALSRAAMQQFSRMKNVFNPYLQLHPHQNWFTRLAIRINRWVNQEIPTELKSRYQSS
jgi:hypothetical protein